MYISLPEAVYTKKFKIIDFLLKIVYVSSCYLSLPNRNKYTHQQHQQQRKTPWKEKLQQINWKTQTFVVCVLVSARGFVEKSAQIKMHSISNNKQKYIPIWWKLNVVPFVKRMLCTHNTEVFRVNSSLYWCLAKQIHRH